MVELVVVDQAGEAVLAAVPDVPDEGAVVEPLAVLLEEAVAEPVVERRARLAPASVSSLSCSDADHSDPKAVRKTSRNRSAAGDSPRTAGMGTMPSLSAKRIEVVRFLIGPAVAEQPGHGDLERVGRALRVALEEPLGGVVAVGFGEAVRVFLGGDLLPAFEVEGDLDQRGVRDVQLLVYTTDGGVKLVGLAEAPDCWQDELGCMGTMTAALLSNYAPSVKVHGRSLM